MKTKSKTTRKKSTKRKSGKKTQVASVFHILSLSLVLSLAWAFTDRNNVYPILLTSLFGLSLSFHALFSGPVKWKEYVKNYKKKKGTTEVFFAPNKTAYYTQMYFVFPAVGVVCFLGVVLSARLILGM